MPGEFTYPALERGHIRLLRLLPAGSSNVSCELVDTKLESRHCPRFMALSYSWEDQASYRPLFVDGQLIRITPNAEAFLRQAEWANSPRNSAGRTNRESSFLRKTDLFWIDAICVNQADSIERASQVQMMRQIYESATYIAIWLGVPSKNTAHAFEYLKSCHQNSKEFPSMRKQRSVEGLTEILERSYWSRSWVLQEATTPKSSERIAVLCGDLEVSFDCFLELPASSLLTEHDSDGEGSSELSRQTNGTKLNPYMYGISKELSRMSNIDFVSIMKSLSQKATTVDAGRLAASKKDLDIVMGEWETKYGTALPRTAHMLGIDLNSLLGNMFRVELQPRISLLCPPEDTRARDEIACRLWEERIGPLRTLTDQRRRSRSINFYTLPRLIRLQQASDPRDKLFAPLQLTTHAQAFVPSYEKPTWVIYCEFAAAVVASDELLDLLSFGHKPVPSETVLPSWVPDWTRKYPFSPLPPPKEKLSRRGRDLLETIIDAKADIDDDIVRSLRGRIGDMSEDLIPAEYQRLRPTKKPRLTVCGMKIGELQAKGNFARFADLSEYFPGRVSFTFSKPKDSEYKSGKRETTIFGEEDGDEDEVLVLTTDAAMVGDEVFYVFGARYPLLLRQEAERPFDRLSRGIERFFSSSSSSKNAKPSNKHPDGLTEYCFCGEVVCRADPKDEEREDAWTAREEILSLFSWGQSPSYYARIMRRLRENNYRDTTLSAKIEEIAIV